MRKNNIKVFISEWNECRPGTGTWTQSLTRGRRAWQQAWLQQSESCCRRFGLDHATQQSPGRPRLELLRGTGNWQLKKQRGRETTIGRKSKTVQSWWSYNKNISLLQRRTYLYRVQVRTSPPWQDWSSTRKLRTNQMRVHLSSINRSLTVKCAKIKEVCLTWNFTVHKRRLGLLGDHSRSGVINLVNDGNDEG